MRANSSQSAVAERSETVRLPLSVFLITRNEEARLAKTLAAVQPIAGEIVVVDSGSTDQTVEIARSYGARVVQQEWLGYGPQKRFAEEQCRHDWLFNLDADEVVTPELSAEIEQFFADGPPGPGAFRVRIRNVYPGEAQPRRFSREFNVVRLYHRTAGRYRDHPTHDRVVLQNHDARQLRGTIYHFHHLSLEHLVEKLNRSTSLQARQTKPRSLFVLRLRMLTEMPVTFFRSYFFRGHFAGGINGFAVALTESFMRALRIAKMIEQQRLSGDKS